MTLPPPTRDPPDEWSELLERIDPASPVRAVIEESWGRCSVAGLDPTQADLHRVSDAELTRRLEARADLLESARPHVDWISGMLSATAHVVYVTDEDGIVLLSTGNRPSLLEEAGLEPGYDWSERRMGTNGAGTALATGRAQAVVGDEHFTEAFRGCTCTAAPIVGTDGDLVGALDITTLEPSGVAERLMLASYAARVIGQGLEDQAEIVRMRALKRVALASLTSAEEPVEDLQAFPGLLVPTLADWAVLRVFGGRDMARACTAHRDPGAARRLSAAWQEGDPAAWNEHPVRRVLESGEPWIAHGLTMAELARIARGAEEDELRAGRGSVLCVPIVAGQRCAAALLLGAGPGRRAFGGRDLELAGELGSIAALVLEKTGLERELDHEVGEAERAREEVRFQAELLDAVEQAVIATDPTGAIVYWNRFAERLYGWSSDEVLGCPVEEVTPAPSSEDEAAEILARLGRGESWSGRFRVRRRDGTDFLAQVWDSPVHDSKGELIGVVGVSYDCTAEEALVRSERAARDEAERRAAEAEEGRRTLDAMLAHVPAAVMIATAPDVRIVHVSRHTEQVLGRPPEVLRTEAGGDARARAWGILHTDGTPASDAELPLTRAVEQGATIAGEEWLIQRQDGSRRTVSVSAGPIRTGGGDIVAGIVAWHDVTVLKEAHRSAQEGEARLQELYDAAEAAARAREEVLAVVSHDLRNPLGVIRTASDVLDHGGLPEERRAAQLRLIRRSAEQMVRLIDDLLDVSAIRAGALRVDLQPLLPAALVDRAVAMIEPLAQAEGVDVRSDVRTDLAILGDPGRLAQVLGNLLSNALHHGGRGGEIRVSVTASEGGARFTVSDDGPGIPSEERWHLFDRFWRGRRTERRGAGLGLTICHGLVSAHGGRIWLDTEVERGATIHFTIPFADRP